MSETNDRVNVNSKTLSIRNHDDDFDESIINDYLENVTFTYLESGNIYIQCDSLEIAQLVHDCLVEDEKKVRIVSYSLFFRSVDELTEEDATTIFGSMCDVNIVYIRVDSNGHTGKLVVDTWEDYKVFKEYEDDEQSLKFYHFDPRAKSKIRKGKKNRGKNRNEDVEVEDDESDC
jgi:hypothetical protein